MILKITYSGCKAKKKLPYKVVLGHKKVGKIIPYFFFLFLINYSAAKSAPALNLTVFLAGILITALVLGLIPFLAAF